MLHCFQCIKENLFFLPSMWEKSVAVGFREQRAVFATKELEMVCCNSKVKKTL